MSLQEYRKSLGRPAKVAIMKSIKETQEFEEHSSNHTPLPKLDSQQNSSSQVKQFDFCGEPWGELNLAFDENEEDQENPKEEHLSLPSNKLEDRFLQEAAPLELLPESKLQNSRVGVQRKSSDPVPTLMSPSMIAASKRGSVQFDQFHFRKLSFKKGYNDRRKNSDYFQKTCRLWEEFNKRQDFGSPMPAVEIFMPFQKGKKHLDGSGSQTNIIGLKKNRKSSDSSVPIEVIMKIDSPMKLSVYKEMTYHIFHALNIIKQIPEKPPLNKEQTLTFSFQKPGFKKLLIFDLDETLIHCQRDELIEEDPDSQYKFVPDIWIDIYSPQTEEWVKTGFTVRPYAIKCLKEANKNFEVAVFTAGFDWYANPIIDYLDPQGKLVQHRFFRKHCTFVDDPGLYIKDLRVFNGISLSQMLIIDNFVYSFAFHLENGIPMVPFYGDKDDKEMIKLIKYINSISKNCDLRSTNMNIFKLHKIFKMDIENFIEYYDSNEIVDIETTPLNSPCSSTSEVDSILEEEKMEEYGVDYLQFTSTVKNTPEKKTQSSDPQHNECCQYQGQHNLMGEKGGTQEQNFVGLCQSCTSTLQESIVPPHHRSSSITDSPSFINRQLKMVNSLEVKEEIKSTSNVRDCLEIPLMISAPNNSSKRHSCQSSKRGDSQNKRKDSIPKEVEESLQKWQQAYEKSWQTGSIQKIVGRNKRIRHHSVYDN